MQFQIIFKGNPDSVSIKLSNNAFETTDLNYEIINLIYHFI